MDANLQTLLITLAPYAVLAFTIYRDLKKESREAEQARLAKEMQTRQQIVAEEASTRAALESDYKRLKENYADLLAENTALKTKIDAYEEAFRRLGTRAADRGGEK
jgi:septal ring factor EnvC (AmiA/AmiB activator)